MRRMPVPTRTVVPFHPNGSGARRCYHNPLADHASAEKAGGDDHGNEQFRHTLEHRALLDCKCFPIRPAWCAPVTSVSHFHSSPCYRVSGVNKRWVWTFLPNPLTRSHFCTNRTWLGDCLILRYPREGERHGQPSCLYCRISSCRAGFRCVAWNRAVESQSPRGRSRAWAMGEESSGSSGEVFRMGWPTPGTLP